MGKAKILSGGPNGLYRLELDYSLPGQDAERLDLIARRDKLTLELVQANEDLGLRTQEVDQTVQTLNAMLEDWRNRKLTDKDPDPPIDPEKDKPKDPEDPADPEDPPDLGAGLLAAHNAIRAQHGLGSLGSHSSLTSAARSHAQWMVTNGLSHAGAGGSTPTQRILAAGYPNGPGRMAGENVAGGQVSVAEVMAGWMNSPPHRANILHPDYEEMGVGYVYNNSSTYYHYWVVNFGRQPD